MWPMVMNSHTLARRERRRHVRLAVIIAVVALVVYVGWWLKAVL